MLDHNAADGWSVPVLFSLITAYWLPQAIYTVTVLAIPDLLTSGPMSAQELSVACDCDAQSLGRLMEALCSAQVFDKDGQGRFSLTALSRHLRSGTPASLRQTVLTKGRRDYQAWSGLLEAVRTGRPAHDIVFGKSLYEDLAGDVSEVDSFGKSMEELVSTISNKIDAVLINHGIVRLMDIGGGNGRFLTDILLRLPRVHGRLIERPEIAAVARERIIALGLASRCVALAGDFFGELPNDSDAISAIRVLHNWSDGDAVRILTACRNALPPGGLLLAIEPTRELDRNAIGAFADLNMMVLTGGVVRTVDELRMLASQASFALHEVIDETPPFQLLVFKTLI